MAILSRVESIETKKGIAQGIKLEWDTGWCFLISAPKGIIACGAFDKKALEKFGITVARIRATVDSPINTLQEFITRKITDVNDGASKLGINIGMECLEALERLF